MDISETLAPNSDQLDAVDLLGGPPRIFTITEVSRGNAEQPVNVHLAEFPRVWRPGKTMRRVLAHCWSTNAKTWVGKRVELYCDTNVMFGGEKVGGTRISRLSHIDKPMSVPVIVKKGRSAGYKVEPLPDVPAEPPVNPAALAENIAEAATADEVKKVGNFAHAKGVLDAEVDGRPLREHVTGRLADFAEQERTEAESDA